ncbi:right-handed parallel beta-helix repeat-containing protein [Pseudomonas sp. CM25]|uniref:right-handed parallel beta-helix repeat-containing protein n=1 Tax=Pseudomonas sp. CM25 TaxID=2738448 RepID=UPI0015538A68|nr:right-handed parallel beta-helix repeat-containing protein [Pseudomonas sp. CM25]NQD58031.1 right-handed parallel beta-helix repeat-containing protein [Pseudomonas sp. CM25]
MIYIKSSAVLSMIVACLAASTAGASAMDCDIPEPVKQGGIIKLEGACTYKGTIKILQSNTRLECNGATLYGGEGDRYGIFIKGVGLKNVEVSNCRLHGYDKAAVMVTSGLSGEELAKDRDKSYTLAPSNIVLDGLEVSGSRGNGVHFNAYVNNSILKRSTIAKSRGVGVYLGQSSRGISIVDNKFIENGGIDKPKGHREALAIDSSARNIVKGNIFSKNAAGAIFLYKNCGEKFDRPGAVLRWQSSNDNLIESNVFKDEKVGVWVASRQSRDLSRWKCGDDPVSVDGKYYRDYANNNKIKNNIFCRNGESVRVEGDNNLISSNRFDVPSSAAVVMPFVATAKPDGNRTVGNRVEGGAGLSSADEAQCR